MKQWPDDSLPLPSILNLVQHHILVGGQGKNSLLPLELPIKALLDAPAAARMALLIEQNRTKPFSDEEINRLLNEIEAIMEGEV